MIIINTITIIIIIFNNFNKLGHIIIIKLL